MDVGRSRIVLTRARATIGTLVLGVLLGGSSLSASPGPAVSSPTPGAPRGGSVVSTPTVPDATRPPASRPAGRLVERRDWPRNEIANLRADSLSGQAMQVTVDYAYAGDQGTEGVFLHAAALQYYSQNAGLRGRVPGTGFPGEAVSVGNGRITLTITRVVEGDASTSTSVRVCLISLPKRSAFLCRNFAHSKQWD